jgi:uncharacterized protein YaeQ
VALSATIHSIAVGLADADRGVYEALALKVARHPSESAEFLATRVLAYCLEYAEGIAFSRGLSEPDEPAICVRDLTGALRAWIEVGTPDAARVHKAAKAAPRVAVYSHRGAQPLERLAGEKIHRAEAVELLAIDRELIGAFAQRLDRRMALDLSVTGRHLYVSLGGETMAGEVNRVLFEG